MHVWITSCVHNYKKISAFKDVPVEKVYIWTPQLC